jgi:hypothetical protein
MTQIARLARQAARTEKQAFAPLMRAAIPAIKSVSSKVAPVLGQTRQYAGNFAKSVANPEGIASRVAGQIIRPTIKPNPQNVAKAAPILAQNNPGMFGRALNYTANVPKGELFRQRPVNNTLRLMSLSGLPGMTRLNQAALGLTAYNAATGYNYLNDQTNQLADKATEVFRDQTPGFDWQGAMHGAKRDLLYDQTAGALGRRIFGESNLRQQAADSTLQNLGREAVSRYVYDAPNKPKNTFQKMTDAYRTWRNPASAVQSVSSGYLSKVLAKPRPLPQLARDVTNSARGLTQTGQPTSVENILQKRFGPAVEAMSSEEKQKLLAILAAGLGVAGTAAIR